MKAKKVSDAILDKLIASNRSENKATCWVAGVSSCGDHTSRVIVASPSPITVQAAVKCVADATNGAVVAFPPSFFRLESEAHPNTFFASIHAYKNAYKVRPVTPETMKNCAAITASSYLDTELNSVWEKQEIDGVQYLVRANDDNPTEVLQTSLLASVEPHARIDSEGFTIEANAGDYVTYFALEAADQVGGEVTPYIDVARVKSVAGDSVTIELEEAGYTAEATIKDASIVNVVTAAALDGETSRKDVIDFLKQCYPAEYAQVLDTLK